MYQYSRFLKIIGIGLLSAVIVSFIFFGIIVSNGDLKKARYTGFPYVNKTINGSSVAISSSKSLTASHSVLDDSIKSEFVGIYSHKKYDVSIYSENNDTHIALGDIPKIGDELVTIGWPILKYSDFRMRIDNREKMYGEGVFLGWLTLGGVKYGVTNSGVATGMSGGAVINNDEELIGIITGIATNDKYERKTIFVPINNIYLWLIEGMCHEQSELKRN